MATEKVQENQDNTSTAGNLPDLAIPAKKITGKISVTAEQSLEILASVLEALRRTGITVQITPLFDQGHTSTVIVLVDVKLAAGHLLPPSLNSVSEFGEGREG